MFGVFSKYVFYEDKCVCPAFDRKVASNLVYDILDWYCCSSVSGLCKEGKSFQMFIETQVCETFTAEDCVFFILYLI